MREELDELMRSIEEMQASNKKLLRCTQILTEIIGRGKRGSSDERFCNTHLTKQEVLELTELGGEE